MLQNCTPYLWHVGKEQVLILTSRENFDSYLKAHPLSPQNENKIQKLKEALVFAHDVLHLKGQGNFQTIVHLEREEIGWNLSATEKLSFQSYTWWFPIVGNVPYLGFFDKKKAEEEESKLKTLGWDTRVRITGGYSTLGYFHDPLFSTQLKWEEEDLIGLLFHELSHATVYHNGEDRFNESYASFVEEKGRVLFYSQKEGGQRILQSIEQKKEKNKKFSSLLKETANQLDQIYKSNLPDLDKLKQKEIIVSEFKNQVDTAYSLNSDQKKRWAERDWNNEDFKSFLRYKSGDQFWEKEFLICQSDFRCFHERMSQWNKLPKEIKKQAFEE
jgi:predicted aminopeptidase